MSARVAHGEGAHLLEVKAGIEPVLPTRCEAARASRRSAGVAQTVVSTGINFAGKRSEKEEAPNETVVFQCPCQASRPGRDVGPSRATPPSAALSG